MSTVRDTQPADRWSVHRPRKGDPVSRQGMHVGVVRKVEDELCFLEDSFATFIWCFHDELNTQHDWPTKAKFDAPATPGGVR